MEIGDVESWDSYYQFTNQFFLTPFWRTLLLKRRLNSYYKCSEMFPVDQK